MAPSNAIDITAYGARGDGRTDNTVAIQRAFDAAKAANKSIFIPEGTFNHSGVLRADGIDIVGAGDRSVLHATNPERSALYLSGTGGSVADVLLSTADSKRIGSYDASKLVIVGARDFVIDDITINGAGGAGIIVAAGTNGIIRDNTVKNTNADSIHMVDESRNITVERNRIMNSGDDGISVVSYRVHGGPVRDIIVRNNTVENNEWARGLSVVGGENVQIIGNTVKSSADHAGVYIAQEKSYASFGVNNVTVRDNHLIDTGGTRTGHGAITVYNAGEADIRGVVIEDNHIDDARKTAFVVNGSRVDGVRIDDNVIDGAKVAGVFVMNGARNVVVTDNLFDDVSGPPVTLYNTPAANVRQSGNSVGDAPGYSAPKTTDPVIQPPPPPPAEPPAAMTPLALPTKPPGLVEIGQGPDMIELRLAGEDFRGEPQFLLIVDGRAIGSAQTVNVDAGTGLQTFRYRADLPGDPDTLTIRFLNDLYQSGVGDRNIKVGGITVNGQAVDLDHTDLRRSGDYHYDIPGPASPVPPDTIVVRAAGDHWQGSPQFRLLADGKQVGAIQTVTAKHGVAWQDFAFQTDLPKGTARLAVEFLNDGWGGTASTDRNLYIQTLTVNGESERLSTTLLKRNGEAFVDVRDEDFSPVATVGADV